MNDPWLVFLHGVSASKEDQWREPLNNALSWFGHEPFHSGRIITPDYREALKGVVTEAEPVPRTWKRPPRDVRRQAITAYMTRMASLEAKLRPMVNASPSAFIPPQVKSIPPLPWLVDDAKRYARDKEVRSSVHEIVLKSLKDLPHGVEVVILAHSLGTVVAADVIKKLPPRLRVSALITIGSPLAAVGELRSADDLSDFPYDRLGAWVNIYEPRDPVTGGKGIGKFYPEVCDLPVALSDWIPGLVHQHLAHFYCAHPSVAGAITGSLHGTAVATLSAVPARDVAGLELPLLQSLYLRELAKRLPTDDHDRVARFERARQTTAADHTSASLLLHQSGAATALLPPEAFLQRPDAPIRGAWNDPTLLALAIMLASGSPAPPYQIEEEPDTEERRLALVATLSLVRTGASDTTDVDMVDAVFAAREEVADVLATGRSWVPAALVTAGVVTLAATGVGIAFVAPAGLVGAALITSTLAAFGPGGMVGGMATLAALAGAGSAMAAAGAAFGVAGAAKSGPDLMGTAIDEAIRSSDPESLRSLLLSILTLVAAQERIGFPTQRDPVLFACENARGSHALRAAAHDEIDPKSRAAKSAHSMLALLDKALAWLRGEETTTSADARELGEFTKAYREAVAGRPELLETVLQRPIRQREAPAANEGPLGSEPEL